MNHKAKYFILLTTVTTVSLHIINKVQYSLCTGKNLLSGKESLSYEWRFGNVHYTKAGKGERASYYRQCKRDQWYHV